MREASAFSPGHITGVFEIRDEPEDPLLKGSRGAGFSIRLGVSTRVRVSEAEKPGFSICINGEPTRPAEVSERVLRMLLPRAGGVYEARVDHHVQVPVGAGFGSSGAGALSLALALNEALGLGLTRVEAGQVAHIAEVECRTGLGTVIAAFHGGLEVRFRPGAPGVGGLLKMPLPGGYAVACLCLGPLYTKGVLGDAGARRRVNEAADGLVEELLEEPEPERFMKASRLFTERVGLATERVRRVMAEAGERGLECGMMMLGESVFSLLRRERVGELLQVYRRHEAHGAKVIVTEVDPEGARLQQPRNTSHHQEA